MFRRNGLIVALLLACFSPVDHGFYVPGVAPVEFAQGDTIDVLAIKLTSVKTQLPYEYYSLPFCRPKGEIEHMSENLGEVLRGDRIVNTPYLVKMNVDVGCAAVCVDGNSSVPTLVQGEKLQTLIRRIKEEYHVHLLVDNLPCATKLTIGTSGEAFYEIGYRLGFVSGSQDDPNQKKVHVNNHLNMVFKYHEHASGQYRVVGFEVTPRSIRSGSLSFIGSTCSLPDDNTKHEAQVIDENAGTAGILWTYSVHWEKSPIPWASRWDTYLDMKDVEVHWFSIVNSIIVVICLSGFLSVIIVRTVRRDIAQYNRDEDLEDTLEETGWKLVHGDVFRPPPYAKLLTSFVGSGVQLFGMSLVTIICAMLGMLSPSSRGSLMSAALFLFCFMGLVSGYYAGRVYKTVRGVQWKRAAFQTGFLFPAIIFGTGLFLNFFLIGKHSSGAVPFTTMLALLFLWFGIDMPLVFLGFYFGFRKQMYEHPVRTNQIPRQVPEQPWYLRTFPCMCLAGILPFGAMFIELFFIFTALWENQFYYMFGFLFLVFIILAISCAQISIVVSYFQLCAENYHWWWKSFIISGGSAVYLFGYSAFYYFTKLEIVGFIPTLLYFGYSTLMAIGFWLLTGTIGFYASYWFTCKIYGAVKID